MYIQKLQNGGLIWQTAKNYLKNRACSFTHLLKIQTKKFAYEIREKATNNGNAPVQVFFSAQIVHAATTKPKLFISLVYKNTAWYGSHYDEMYTNIDFRASTQTMVFFAKI